MVSYGIIPNTVLTVGLRVTSLIVVLSRCIGPRKKTYRTRFYVTQKNKIATLFHHTMTISAAATASPRSRQIPSQHRVRGDLPHRNIVCDHPATWFGQIRRISREIAPFLPCNFCYTATIMTGRGKDGSLLTVSLFYQCLFPDFITYIIDS